MSMMSKLNPGIPKIGSNKFSIVIHPSINIKTYLDNRQDPILFVDDGMAASC